MMRLVPVAVSLVVALALAGGAAEARRPYRPPPPPPAVDVGAELGAAIRGKNAARVAKLLGDSVQNYGVLFADAACAKQFGAPGIVTGPELQAFARCLAGLKLLATTRQPGATNNAILTYDPGIELELSHSGGRVRWIGFQYQTEQDRGRPTLTAQAFEALRKSGKTNLDDVVGPKLEPVLERSKAVSVSAWMKLCVDEEGTLDHVVVRQTDAPTGQGEKVSTTFEIGVTRNWRFRPFTLRGKPMPVCTMALVTYPASRAPLVETLPPAVQPSFSLEKASEVPKRPRHVAPKPIEVVRPVDEDEEDEEGIEGGVEGGVAGGVVGGVVGGVISTPPPTPPPPPPPPPPQVVPPTVLEGMRVKGNKNIVPDDPTKTQITRDGKDKLVGSFKLCLDRGGAVMSVNQLKSTGYPAYDAKITSEMKQWGYQPYVVNGKPVPVCTAVTFIYSQVNPTPPPPPPPATQPAKPTKP